jgi:hypothetical protein
VPPPPPEDLETGYAKPRQRLADEIRHHAKIFSDDLGAGVAEDRNHSLAEDKLIGLVIGREECSGAILWPAVGAVEPHEVIDPIAVVQIAMVPGAIAQPPEIGLRDHVPSVRAFPSSARWR